MPDLTSNDIRDWWMNPNIFGTCLLALAIDQWGTKVFSFEPETIRLELRGTCRQDPPQVNMDKLMAMIAALTTNMFYVSVETFVPICEALNHSEADFYNAEPLDPEEAAWGVAEISLNDEHPETGPNSRAEQFSHEVKRYMGAVLTQFGIDRAPAILKFAEMDEPENKVENSFSDDPAMVRAFYERQRKEGDEITDFVRLRTLALIRQLERVPLRNRDQDTWRQFASKALSRLEQWKSSEEPDQS